MPTRGLIAGLSLVKSSFGMKKVIFFLFLFLITSASLVAYWLYLPISSNSTPLPFVINQGDGLKNISLRLYKNQFTKNKYAFFVYATVNNSAKDIKAGGFQLSQADNLSQILTKLTTGGRQDFWLKIIPGTRLEEITSKFTFDSSLEGYLFPDSYLIPNYYSTDDTLKLIKDNFDQKTSEFQIAPENLARVVTLASLLEREAKTRADRQMVAGIINNRLQIDMALQIDAAVQYARDSKIHPAKYWLPLSSSDLKIVSPFNTYLNPGLPPSPICNPSLDSIFAAANPIPSDYLYYIHTPDGKMYFAKTLSEHNANVAKYLR